MINVTLATDERFSDAGSLDARVAEFRNFGTVHDLHTTLSLDDEIIIKNFIITLTPESLELMKLNFPDLYEITLLTR